MTDRVVVGGVNVARILACNCCNYLLIKMVIKLQAHDLIPQYIVVAFLASSGVISIALIWRIHATTIWCLVLPYMGYNPASGFSLFSLTHVLTMCVSVSPAALVAVVLLYTLFLLASVPYGYLLGFGGNLPANCTYIL
jgi:hypothetical protein